MPTVHERIESTLETIRPALHMDGGDVEFVEFDDDSGTVMLRLVGACGACPISSTTMRFGIEKRLKSMVPEVRDVQAIG